MNRHSIRSEADARIETEYWYREGAERPENALGVFDTHPVQMDAPSTWRCDCGKRFENRTEAVEHLKEMSETEGEYVE